jgi:hypothetical protein
MKIENLAQVLERRSRIKLHVTQQDAALTLCVTDPEPGKILLEVATDSALRVVFATSEINFNPFGIGALDPDSASRFTRRIQTHRRHSQELQIPAACFNRAAEL